jgi:dTDP-4-dehydrorhamnose 3,5-epimerase
MKIHKTPIDDVLLLEAKICSDDRGFFLETFNDKLYQELGLRLDWRQDNFSWSKKNVLRGLHFQRVPHAQAKLVRVVYGKVFDVAVDLRPGSKSYGQHFGVELDSDSQRAMYIPEGFAHGFCVLSDFAGFSYKCSQLYAPSFDGGVRYNDPDIGIRWPIEHPLLSPKDEVLPLLRDLKQP